MWISRWGAVALVAATCANVSCLMINQDHCAVAAGGSCGEGLQCSVCEPENNGCVEQPAEGCAYDESSDVTSSPTSVTSDPGTTSEIGTTGSSDASDASFTTTGSPTTGDPDTTGDPGCDPASPVSAECSQPQAPYCVDDGVCGTCQDLSLVSCGEVDPSTPACDAGSGLCVECTEDDEGACSDPNGSCNPYTLECGVCFEHSQCPSGACNRELGVCFAPEPTVWVKRRLVCDGENGTEEQPYCDLQTAIDQATNAGLVIKLQQSGELAQNTTMTVNSGHDIAIINAQPFPAPPPVIDTSTQDKPAVAVSGSRLYFEGVRFENNPQPTGVSLMTVDAGRLDISGSWLRDNVTLPAIMGGTLVITRSVLADNQNGILLTGGRLELHNSVLANNGVLNMVEGEPPGLNKYAPLTMHGDSVIDVRYTTFLNNAGLFTSVLECYAADDNNLFASSIRNSVLIGKQPLEFGQGGGPCDEVVESTNYTLSFPAMLDEAALANVLELPADQNGLYHAVPGGMLDGQARWQTGDPFMDYDGQARPNENDASDYAGADLP